MQNIEELNNYSDDLKEEYEVIKNSYYEKESIIAAGAAGTILSPGFRPEEVLGICRRFL